MQPKRTSIWSHDSNETASGKPGTLHSLHNYWAWDHMHGAVTSAPLITLDMYEHSYHMDYGTQAAKYIDAFMANLDWEVIDARFRAAIG